MFAVPGIEPGKTGRAVELLSVYPTLVELCGLPKNRQLEGVSLAPLIKDAKAPWRHAAISTLGQGNHAVRDERWRYIRYADGSEELYDHTGDPNEWENVLFGEVEEKHKQVAARMRALLPASHAKQRGEVK
jgi:arylsulfatase A-like enzyme